MDDVGQGLRTPDRVLTGPTLVIGGIPFAVGTYEDARAMVGVAQRVSVGDLRVSRSTILQFVSAVEDANPSYWDEEFAKRQWGGLIAPPAMLMVWVTHLRWHPDGSGAHSMLLGAVPLPGNAVLNISNDAEFFDPIREGDLITMTETVLDVSPEKSTKVGVGHFITTQSLYTREDGVTVASQVNTALRFTAHDGTTQG